MKAFDIGELVLLAALWGASFLFMRLGAHEFGPIALAAVRVGLASAMLIPLLASRGALGELRKHWKGMLIVGALNSAIPFALFSFAALSITAGLSSIVNATTPLWTAVVAFIWLRQGLTPLRVLGLVIGFAGVAFLAWDKASFKPGADHSGLWAVLACATATFCYGVAANATKRYLTGASPLAVATGSQFAAALLLALPAAWLWPAAMPGTVAWSSAFGLAALCTALACSCMRPSRPRWSPAAPSCWWVSRWHWDWWDRSHADMKPLVQSHAAERGAADGTALRPEPAALRQARRVHRTRHVQPLPPRGWRAGSVNWSRTQAVPADCLCLRKAMGLWPMAGPALGPKCAHFICGW